MNTLRSQLSPAPTGILQTKLHPPHIRTGVIPRQQIFGQLHEQDFRLLLVTAPAGFGKSITTRSWLADTGLQFTWLSLDEHDNDQKRFVAYLIAAFRQLDGSIGEVTLEMLSSDSLPAIDSLLTPVLNDLFQLSEEVILILDDYHLIESPKIHDTVRFLIDQLPPNIRLGILTRVDPPFPVSKYRARGDLAEIREQDLRFTEEETERFLNVEMKLDLAEKNLKTLNEKTEGWAAGLQLASLSIQLQ